MSQYIAVVKLGYVPVVGDDEEVTPSNLGALRYGLEALQKEDASDYPRAQQLWEMAEAELAREVSDDTGAGAEGGLNVDDAYDMASLGEVM